MTLFVSPTERHCNLIRTMRERAFRKPNEGIDCVLQWEAVERCRPIKEGVVQLSTKVQENLLLIFDSDLSDDEVEHRKRLIADFDEYSSEWEKFYKTIEENSFDSTGPKAFLQIDEFRFVLECIGREFSKIGLSIEPIKVTEETPAPPEPPLLQKIDWRHLALAGAGVGALYLIFNRKNLQKPSFLLSEDEKKEKEEKKNRVGPPVLAKSWAKNEHGERERG